MSGVSSHVLDTAIGKPAVGVPVRLERRLPAPDSWESLGRGMTNAEGRIAALCGAGMLRAGEHRITFETGAYFAARGQTVFYPEVVVSFIVAPEAQHHHIPLLISPFGYSTYRGS